MDVPVPLTLRDEADFDRVLRRLQTYGSGLANGLTSHAPMVVDALASLGRPEHADAWLDLYLPGALPRQAPGAPIDADDWQPALGREDRETGWLARFEVDLAVERWQTVLSRWVERLTPGFAAAAAHGVIRTAHAARALARLDTVPRRTELAAGLALWASTWQPLPGAPLAASGALPAREALRQVPLVPAANRRNSGSITAALGVLDSHRGFEAALAGLDRSRSNEALAMDLATAFAHLFVEQVRTPLQAIVFTHAVTGVAASRRLAPLVGESVTAGLLAHAWQTGAALHACYSMPDARAPKIAVPGAAALVATAVVHGDEHVIKLTEACLDFHGATGEPVFLAAAARVAEAIPPP